MCQAVCAEEVTVNKTDKVSDLLKYMVDKYMVLCFNIKISWILV